MPFASGTYSAPSNSFNPAVTATTISSTDWSTLLADLTTALSTCVLKDGTQTITTNIPMGGFKFTGLAAASANGDSVRYEQSPAGLISAKGGIISASAANTPSVLAVGTNGLSLLADSSQTTGLKWVLAGAIPVTAAAGTNTITGTISPIPSAWVAGQSFCLIPANTNTGAATFNPSLMGAKDIFIWGRACTGGELVIGVPVILFYDGTQCNIVGTAIVPVATQTFVTSADVVLNNTANYFNVINTGSIGAANQTWRITACATVLDTAGAANIEVRIWDGTTVYANTAVSTPATGFQSVVTISAIVTLAAAATFSLSCKDQTSTSGVVKQTGFAGTANKATWILAERIS